MPAPKRYYFHGMTPYAYEWRGAPAYAYQRNQSSLGAEGSSVVLGLGGTLAVVMLFVWLGAKK